MNIEELIEMGSCDSEELMSLTVMINREFLVICYEKGMMQIWGLSSIADGEDGGAVQKDV